MSTKSTDAFDFGHPPSTIHLGDLEVCRLGFGAMRLPGPDVWGEPADPDLARSVVRRAIELGVNFIDTSWYYGPYVANRLIADALYPYPSDLVIATKLGGRRLPDKGWAAALRPEELRKGCEDDLSLLRLERTDVTHLRYVQGADVDFHEALDAMIELKREGKIRHLGLSNVSADQLSQALEKTPVVAVQNMFNVAGGGGFLAKATGSEVDSPEAVLDLCTERGIAYLPFFPLLAGTIGKSESGVSRVANRLGVTPAQVAIAWLLARSPIMLPIPGTGSLSHLEENCAAHKIQLSPEDFAEVTTD
ncbi:MAG TPA: aldo/keto reductase [Blastocatellia bacterium]